MKSNGCFISVAAGTIWIYFSFGAAVSIARVIKDFNSFLSIFIIKRNDSKNLYLSNIFSIFGKNLIFLIVYIHYLLIQNSFKSFNDFDILGCNISFV